MNTFKHYCLAITCSAALLVTTALRAAEPKSYQVTGPVLELTDTTITVQKGDEKWQIARGSAKVNGELKLGAKVTVYYTMTAKEIEVKDTGKGEKKGKK